MEIQNNSTKIVYLNEVIVKGDQSVCKFVIDESLHREAGSVIAMIEPNSILNIKVRGPIHPPIYFLLKC